ncbi:MAG: hypothetical protein RL734_596 [Bacteroidota bacterium]|jgi:hypothetical protein
MNHWRIIQLCSIFAIIVLSTFWIIDGFQIFTKDKTEKITIVKDELFGTDIEKREWIEDFQLGLLPDDPLQPYRSVAFPALICIALILFAQNRLHSQKNI